MIIEYDTGQRCGSCGQYDVHPCPRESCDIRVCINCDNGCHDPIHEEEDKNCPRCRIEGHACIGSNVECECCYRTLTAPGPVHTIEFLKCDQGCDFTNWVDPETGMVEGAECPNCDGSLTVSHALSVTPP